MTILVQAAHVEFAYGGHQIFDDITFEIKAGERLALIGRNGTGKSTLFRLLAKRELPQGGSVVWKRGVSIGFMTQDTALPPQRTVYEILDDAQPSAETIDRRLAELEAKMADDLDDEAMADVLDTYNALLESQDVAAGGDDREGRLLDVLAGLGISEERWFIPSERLSGGEKKIVTLAMFLLQRPDVLLLDEPDNHLDVSAKAWLERFLATYEGAVGLITHDRYLIDQVVNEIVDLEEGQLRTYPGNYSLYLQHRRDRKVNEREAHALQVREVKRVKESSEQLTQWARQNPKFAPRAENMRRRLEEERQKLEAMPNPRLDDKVMQVEFANERGGTLVLETSALAMAFGERTIFRPFDLAIRNGERVGLVGPNGAGKTTLFRMILGQIAPTAGSLRLGAAITPGYYAQEHETLTPTMTPLEFIRSMKAVNETQALAILSTYDFDFTKAYTPSGKLSGGERSRLQILGLILAGANFLLLDEPTNNFDIASTEALEEALLDQAGTILAISHDRYFLDKICTRIIEIGDGLVRDYPGGYAAYRDMPDVGTWATRDWPPRVEVPVGKRRRKGAAV